MGDASGHSAKISALGGKKWRAYRANSALQVPADEGGMHMRITRSMFKTLRQTCEVLGLSDPSQDLVSAPDMLLSSEVLEQRFLERQLFQQILGGNGQGAQRILEWALQQAKARKASAYVCAAVCSREAG